MYMHNVVYASAASMYHHPLQQTYHNSLGGAGSSRLFITAANGANGSGTHSPPNESTIAMMQIMGGGDVDSGAPLLVYSPPLLTTTGVEGVADPASLFGIAPSLLYNTASKAQAAGVNPAIFHPGTSILALDGAQPAAGVASFSASNPHLPPSTSTAAISSPLPTAMRSHAHEEPAQLRKLFIGGLSHETSDDQLRDYYSQWGTVVDSIVIRDPMTKQSRGFGFVTYRSVAQADTAMAYRPHTISGKVVDPKRAIPREQMLNMGVGQPTPSFLTAEGDAGTGGDGCKLTLTGIHWDYHTVDGLRLYFERFGEVEQVEIVGQPRGYGFIIFEDGAGATQCLTAGPAHLINGKQVEVKDCPTPMGCSSHPLAATSPDPLEADSDGISDLSSLNYSSTRDTSTAAGKKGVPMDQCLSPNLSSPVSSPLPPPLPMVFGYGTPYRAETAEGIPVAEEAVEVVGEAMERTSIENFANSTVSKNKQQRGRRSGKGEKETKIVQGEEVKSDEEEMLISRE